MAEPGSENIQAPAPPEATGPQQEIDGVNPQGQRNSAPETSPKQTIDPADPDLSLETIANSGDTAPDADSAKTSPDTDTGDTPDTAGTKPDTDTDDADKTATPDEADPANPDATVDAAEAEARAERIQTQRQKDTNHIASNVLLGLKEKYTGAKAPTDADPKLSRAAAAIKFSDELGTADEKYFSTGPKQLPSKPGTPAGEPLKAVVGGKAATIVEVSGVDGNDALKCFIIHDDDPDRRISVSLKRQEVQQANLTAERQTILAAFDGDQKAVVEKYIDHIDPKITDEPVLDDEYQKHLEGAANERGIITTANIRQAIEHHFRDADDLPDTAKVFLQGLEGKTLVDKTDMKQALAVMGVSRFGVKREAEKLADKMKALGDRDDAVAVREREEITQQLDALGVADKLWADAEKKGETPYDKYFDDLVNGKIDPEKAKGLIEAFTKGNMDGFVDSLVTDEKQKAMLKKVLKNSGKVGLFVLLGAIIAAGASAFYAVGVAGGSIGAGLKSATQ